jgi:chromosome segregation ATPase
MVWPFRKKHERIDDTWLSRHRIPTDFDDSFNYSKKKLRQEIERISAEINTWNSKKKEFEKEKVQLQLKMDMLTEQSNSDGQSKSKDKDILAQLRQLDNEFREEVQNYLNAQNKHKELKNIRWLLENILSKTFSEPKKLTDPPKVPEITWNDIFDDLPQIDDIDDEELKEMNDYFGINRNDNSKSNSQTDSSDDEIDPLL